MGRFEYFYRTPLIIFFYFTSRVMLGVFCVQLTYWAQGENHFWPPSRGMRTTSIMEETQHKGEGVSCGEIESSVCSFECLPELCTIHHCTGEKRWTEERSRQRCMWLWRNGLNETVIDPMRGNTVYSTTGGAPFCHISWEEYYISKSCPLQKKKTP